MTARSFKQHELKRALAVLAAEGKSPECLDLLPGGVARIYLKAPSPVASNDTEAMERERAAWDAACGS